MTVIRTERLTLRPATAEDLPAMFEIMSDPRAMTYWSTLPHDSIARTEEWLGRMLDAAAVRPVTDFLIEFDGQVIGKAGYWKPPEVGYILHPAMWGRGFAREAASAVISFGFNALGLLAVTADVDPRNLPSLRLLEKLGFTRTGYAERTYEIGGQWADSIYLTLEKDNFRPHLHPED